MARKFWSSPFATSAFSRRCKQVEYTTGIWSAVTTKCFTHSLTAGTFTWIWALANTLMHYIKIIDRTISPLPRMTPTLTTVYRNIIGMTSVTPWRSNLRQLFFLPSYFGKSSSHQRRKLPVRCADCSWTWTAAWHRYPHLLFTTTFKYWCFLWA